MLKTEGKVFLRIPNEGESAKKRELLPGTVESIEGATLLVRLEGELPDLELPLDAFLHYEIKRKFVQQSMCLRAIDAEDLLLVSLELQGDPVSAESRQNYRSSCLASDIQAKIATETCKVVDVSATGFAVYATKKHRVGAKLTVTVAYNGKEYSGEATVQSARRLNKKETRYGLHCVVVRGKQNPLASSLGGINSAIQSEQLRRLAGNE